MTLIENNLTSYNDFLKMIPDFLMIYSRGYIELLYENYVQ